MPLPRPRSAASALGLLVLGFVLLLALVFATWSWRVSRDLLSTVEAFTLEVQQGGTELSLAREYGVYSCLLDNTGKKVGSVNRDGVDRIGNRIGEWIVGEGLGGDHDVVELDGTLRGAHPNRPEVQDALAGTPSSGCWTEGALLACWAVDRVSPHHLVYAVKSARRPGAR